MCKHKHKTLVQHLSEVGWYSAYQCDMCGMITSDPVPTELFSNANLPNIDMLAYEMEIDRRIQKVILSVKVAA